MRRGLVILILTIVTLGLIFYMWIHQRNEVMVMKHWIELFVLETLMLELGYLLKPVMRKFFK